MKLGRLASEDGARCDGLLPCLKRFLFKLHKRCEHSLQVAVGHLLASILGALPAGTRNALLIETAVICVPSTMGLSLMLRSVF
jgi:hypothetical protein